MEYLEVRVWRNGELVKINEFTEIEVGERFRMFNKDGSMFVNNVGQYEWETVEKPFFDKETNQWMVEVIQEDKR